MGNRNTHQFWPSSSESVCCLVASEVLSVIWVSTVLVSLLITVGELQHAIQVLIKSCAGGRTEKQLSEPSTFE